MNQAYSGGDCVRRGWPYRCRDWPDYGYLSRERGIYCSLGVVGRDQGGCVDQGTFGCP